VYDARGVRPKTRADLERAREELAWVDEDDLGEIESKSRLGAGLLGFFTWGGGRVYVGDVKKGVAGIGALVGWMFVSGALPASLGWLAYVAVGTVGALWANDGVTKVNRFVRTRNMLHLTDPAGPSGYKLLAAAAQVDPNLAGAMPTFGTHPASPHADTVDRLRKLAALHTAGVINEAELKDRKVDLFTELGQKVPDLDELMYALLPLRSEGVLGADDFEFLKQVSTR
jgi:hypothetical protein